MPRVAGFAIDDDNEEKFWAHGLSVRRVLEAIDNRFIVVPNRQGRAAPLLLIGRDNSGQCIAIPISRTFDRAIWRPITAWRCKPGEETRLDRAVPKQGRR